MRNGVFALKRCGAANRVRQRKQRDRWKRHARFTDVPRGGGIQSRAEHSLHSHRSVGRVGNRHADADDGSPALL